MYRMTISSKEILYKRVLTLPLKEINMKFAIYQSFSVEGHCQRWKLQDVLVQLNCLSAIFISFSQARPLVPQASIDGKFDSLVDPRLENKYNPEEMKRMVACAGACINFFPDKRPPMSEVRLSTFSLILTKMANLTVIHHQVTLSVLKSKHRLCECWRGWYHLTII